MVKPALALFVLACVLVAPAGVSADSATVSITSTGFTPAATVTVKQGDTVTWVNTDSATHAVMPRTGGFRASGEIAPGGTFKAKMTKPGR